MAKAISMAGTVVGIMFLMCENRSTPVTAGARFVVSESGDTLSPKNAPDTTAPAVQYIGMPKPAPIPIRARSEEHTSELQSLMRPSYAVFCLKKKKKKATNG